MENRKRHWAKIYNKILMWFFPPRCPVCDALLLQEGELCEKCRDKLVYVKEPFCLKCGKPMHRSEEEYCSDCMKKKHFFTKGRAVFEYDSIAESIYRFKYHNRKEYAEYYAEQIVMQLKQEILSWGADAIVPIPLHRSKYNKRGFNQAEVLARSLGKRLEIPINTKLVKRVRKTRAQKQLNAVQRQNNLKKAFKIVRNDVKLKTIIVIDDIYTTGSTVDALAEELLKTSVKKVYFVTLAIGSVQ